MAPLPEVFQKAATEFSQETCQLIKPNRQWIEDAKAKLNSGQPEYPNGVCDEKAKFNVEKLTQYLFLSHVELRRKLFKLFDHEDFHIIPGESMCEERDRVMRMWSHIVKLGVIQNTLSSHTSEGRARYDSVTEVCGLISHSLDIKMSVHYGLFGSTILMMGDEEQSKKWLPKVENCEMLGCFALTELGHGSNVKGIQTVANYDSNNHQFIIHTPSEFAQKYWIGGAAISARWSAVFAQLYIDNVCYGIHPFLMRIRHDNGNLVKGVYLADCGHKCGMNGVDNGRMWFDHVRIPHEHLLRRHSQVSLDGKYTSSFKSADERFGVSLASLSGGRISVASGSLNQAKIGITIAIRYALSRRAFGAPGQVETRLLDYVLHQRRLIPLLATTICMQLINNRLKSRWHNRDSNRKDIHLWSSGFKALISWHSLATLQEAREACGGQGYKAENRIGELHASHNVSLTYEGDNTILLQAVTKTMLVEFLNGIRNMGTFKGHFEYLNKRNELRDIQLNNMNVRDLENFIKVVMRKREAAVFAKLSNELQKKMKSKSMSNLDAFNDSADLVEEAGKAHTELLMLQVIQNEIDIMCKNGDSDVANIIETCAQLFMLSRIHSQSIFLRVGALTPKDAERVNTQITILCKELRPQVLHLVNSFGLPPHVLSPIAFDYISHNSRSRI